MKTNIEPGCLCVKKQTGEQCVAVKMLPDGYFMGGSELARGPAGPWWELDRPVTWGRDGIARPFATEINLIRIDGHEGEDECESNSNATPVEA